VFYDNHVKEVIKSLKLLKQLSEALKYEYFSLLELVCGDYTFSF
jgi:hypothetical protein